MNPHLLGSMYTESRQDHNMPVASWVFHSLFYPHTLRTTISIASGTFEPNYLLGGTYVAPDAIEMVVCSACVYAEAVV